MSDVQVWKLDESSFILKNAEGLFNFWWAGCLMSDKFCTPQELFYPESIDEMLNLTLSKPTHKFIAKSIDVGGYGEPFSLDCSECVPLDEFN